MAIDKSVTERIFKALWSMKTEAHEETTILATAQRLHLLAKYVDLDNPEQVKAHIVNQNWSPHFKQAVAYAYQKYVNVHGLAWKLPRFKIPSKLPKIPSEQQINMIIAESNCKYALIFSILKETGIRPIELHKLTLKKIDLETGVLYPETSKRGMGRALRITTKTLAMLKYYINKNDFSTTEKIFPDTTSMKMAFTRARNKLSKKLQDPQIKTIRLYDLRHYFGTMLYHKTKDILYVKQQMGHRNIKTTLIYTQLIEFKEDEWTHGVAKTLEEACKLVDAGFEFMCDFEGKKIFRKRK